MQTAIFIVPLSLLVIYYIYPRQQKFPLFGIALDRLGRRRYRQPFLHVLLGGVAFFAEKVKVFFRHCDVALQPEKQVGSCHIGRGVVLGDVRPVKNISFAVVGYYDVGGVKVAVANFVVLGHALEPCVQFVPFGGV